MPDETLRQPLPGGVLPDPIQLVKDSWEEFIDDPMPYLLAGLGQLVILVPVVFGVIFLTYLALFATMFGGLIAGAVLGAMVENMVGSGAGGAVFSLVYIGSWALMLALFVALFGLIGAIVAPTQASLTRRIAEHQRGGRPLDFTACFSDMTQDLSSVFGVALLVSLVVMCGVMACYLPGLVAIVVLSYAGSLVYLHRAGPLEACLTSTSHVFENLNFHGLFALIYIGCSMVAGYIPVAGPMFVQAMHVRAHRTLFGDGDEPVLRLTVD